MKFFFISLSHDLCVSVKKPVGIQWDERDDLTPREKEAVALYLEYSGEVQNYLRHPRELAGREEWSWFQALIYHLDNAVDRSAVQPGDLIFRAVSDDFTRRLLFLLSVDPVNCIDEGFHSITPHIIQDQGYTSFTKDAGRLFVKSMKEARALFVYQTKSSDRALYLGGKDLELLYPRAFRWMTTGFDCITKGTMKQVFITLESFSGGMELS